MKLYPYIMANFKSVSDYARQAQLNYPLVKRWCDKGAIIMNDVVYVPSVQLQDDSAPPTISLAQHIADRYDGNVTAASIVLKRHRNQIYLWIRSDALLINQQIFLPKGVVL